MKKLASFSFISIIFISAWATPKEVVPFLRPIVSDLTEHTNVPVILPTYWSKQSVRTKKHTSVKIKAYENAYMIYFLSTDKPYRANDDALFKQHQLTHIGELSGFVGSKTSSNSNPPRNFVFYKKKDGAKLWIQPWIRSIIYARRGTWTMYFDGDNGDEPYQQADELFEAMKKANWLNNKDMHDGYIAIQGTRREAHTIFSWATDDGYVYHFSYNGPIKEAVKIMDSLRYVD